MTEFEELDDDKMKELALTDEGEFMISTFEFKNKQI